MRALPSFVGVALVLVGPAIGAEPPSIPGGVADPQGQVGFFTNASGGIDAVELSSGGRRWSSAEGQEPLYAFGGLLAVAAPDPSRKFRARVRFLNAADGKVAPNTPTVPMPDAVVLRPPSLMPDRQTPWVTMSAWVVPPAWKVRWGSQYTPVYGMRPTSPVETTRAAGVLVIDPRAGTVQAGPDEERPSSAPALPEGFAPDRTKIYWGGNWSTTTPSPFWIADGVAGAFAYDTGGARQLQLIRWRGREVLPPVMVMAGAEYAPLIAMDGRYAFISVQQPKREQMVLVDLAREGKGPPLFTIGRLEEGFHMPIAVVGSVLLYVVERYDESSKGPGSTYSRQLIALKGEGGARAWSYPLAPRVEAPPVPGGGFPH